MLPRRVLRFKEQTLYKSRTNRVFDLVDGQLIYTSSKILLIEISMNIDYGTITISIRRLFTN